MTIHHNTTSLILAILLNITIMAGVGNFAYSWVEKKELERKLAQDHQRITLELIHNCFGQWTAWTGVGVITGTDGVQVTCNENTRQSAQRAKMIKTGQR